MIELLFQELNNEWSERKILDDIVSAIDSNPFCQLDSMEFDARFEWEKFNIDKAVKKLLTKKNISAEFRGREGKLYRATISKHPLQNTLQMFIDNKIFERFDIKNLPRYIVSFSHFLPIFHWASANPDGKLSEFYDQLDLPWVPECFSTFVTWLHLLTPTGYEKYFNREDLLNVPAFDVQEFDDGIIKIISFENPFEYGRENNRKILIEITNYLNQCRKDWR